MADSAAKDIATKKRIITHMNNDHQDSLIRYLEHFCSLSSFAARNAKLTDMTLDSLTVLSSDRTPYTIPIKPPMTSFSEARPRVVAMDAEAVAGLNRSNITVKKYESPKGFMAFVFVATACTFVVFSKRSNFQPGSVVYDIVMRHVPGFARFCYKIQPVVIYPMVVLHAGEAIYMEKTRLENHTVPRFSKLWWKWLLSTFVEGIGAFVRFDRIVEEEESKKANAKH